MASLAQKRQRSKASSPSSALWWFGGIFFVVLLLVLMLLTRQTALMPAFSATTLDEREITLSDYRGQVVMLNFWATWCPPCRAEMPDIQAAYERYAAEGFVVLAINHSEAASQIAPFVQGLGLQFPIVLDESGRLQRQFGMESYPTSLFIGPDGTTYARHSGMVSPAQLDKYIQTGLAKREA